MPTDVQHAAGKTYCNCLAMEQGLEPVGYAGNFDDAIVVEVPLPWKPEMMQQAGPLPQESIDLLALWADRYKQTGIYRHRPLVVAPDPAYTREGCRRVMHYTRPHGAFARYRKVEYQVPADEVGPLVWSLYEDRPALYRFERYRVPEADSIRDILVCTHGTVDAACARFGYPLYRHLRDTHASEHLRVWRVSHFGGHVFAPTLMDMPIGQYWAYLGEEQAAQILRRTGDVAALRGHYRGWAGIGSGFLQAAEYELWQRHGWDWFDYLKTGAITAQDRSSDPPQWAEVRIRYTVPGETAERVADVRVEISHTVETRPSTAREDTHTYAQYRVVNVCEVARV